MATRKTTEHPLSHRLGYLLKRAQHALRTNMDEALGPLGLTAPQYNVLSAVETEPGISNAELARAAFVTAQSMQGIVANLERIGLIQRNPHPTHGRIRRSELTEEGSRVLAKADQLLIGVEKMMTSEFKKVEVDALRSLLRRCAENLQTPRECLPRPCI